MMEQAAGEPGPCLLLGDFNTTRPEIEDKWISEPWQDCWLQLRGPEDPGYTYDCDANPYASQYRSRLDKVLFKQGESRLQPVMTELLGVEAPPPARDDFSSPPASPEGPPRLAASDHFGLLVVFAAAP